MARPKRKPAESPPADDNPDAHGTPTNKATENPAKGTTSHAPPDTEDHPCQCCDPLHWPSDTPMPASVQAALARLLETRTLATLQEQLTADIIRQEVGRLHGEGSGCELPQKESPFRTLARESRGQSGYEGASRVENAPCVYVEQRCPYSSKYTSGQVSEKQASERASKRASE